MGFERIQPRAEAIFLSSSRRLSVVLLVAAIAYVWVHLLTLVRSPTPFFDDTFYADVAHSLWRTGRLELEMSPLWMDTPIYIYGPLYFVAAAGVFDCIGFGAFQFRLVALAFGLAVLWAVYKLLRVHGTSQKVTIAACALLALDPTFYKGLHSGRMDGMALFFLLASLLLLVMRPTEHSPTKSWMVAVSGVAAAMGILTTPRPAYLVVPLLLIVIVRVRTGHERGQYLGILVWLGCLFLPYAAWIFYAFGSIPAMIAYYRTIPGGSYVGGFGVRTEHLPLLLGLGAVAAAVWLRSRNLSWLRDEQLAFALSGIVLFYLVVHDVGPYVFFMVPLAYLALGLLGDRLVSTRMWMVPKIVITLLLATSLFAFLARNMLIWTEWEARSPDRARDFMARHVPPGSKVVGDDKYYFAARAIGAQFQTSTRGGTLEDRVAHHKTRFHADFFITERSEQSPFVQNYATGLDLEKLGTMPRPKPGPLSGWITSTAAKLGFVPDYGYTGTLYARRRTESGKN